MSCPEYEYVHLGEETIDTDTNTKTEILDTRTWSEDSEHVLDSSANQSSDSWTMDGTEEVGKTVTENEQVVGSQDGDWEHVNTETEVTMSLDQTDNYYPTESGYTQMA